MVLARGDAETDLIIIDASSARGVASHVRVLDVPILLLIDDGAHRHVRDALSAIVPTSVLHRYSPLRTAIVAVDTTLGGGRYLDPALTVWQAALLDDLMSATGLTAREREVCRLVFDGCRTGEVARRLGLSTHTVKHHLSSIYFKVGVSGRGELVELLSSIRWFQ